MFRPLFQHSRHARSFLIRRCLSLQEYQSKQLLAENKCTVQRFFVVDSPQSAENEFIKYDYEEYAVKSQLLAGGRGKGRFIGGPVNFGGVQITSDKQRALNATKTMLGKRLVTKQTTDSGILIKKVLVAESVPIHRETYLAFLHCRETNGPVLIASSKGGMDIEEIAEQHPELIIKEPIDINTGITDEQCERIAEKMKFKGTFLKNAAIEIRRLYEVFLKTDAIQLEINPFAESSQNRVFSIDAKITVDDNAKYRQKAIFETAERENISEDVREQSAHECGLNYVGLDGNIACLVNGAGLAMATMDIIKLHGGEPANFLDVGGAVTEKQVLEAFQIITSDKEKVNAVLVNIFGGIVNCATIAKGVIGAVEKAKLTVPLVVRLEGTNAAEARELLHKSGLELYNSTCLEEATKKVVQLAKEHKPMNKESLINLVAGGISGIASATATCPIEVLKTRMQSSVHGNQGYRALVGQMLQKEGLRSFYKGVGTNIIGVAPAKSIYFCTYSTTKRLLNNTGLFRPNSSGTHMLSAGLAGFATTTATNPIWLIKTRLQINQGRLTTWECIRKVYRNEGFRGFYKGITASYFGISETIIHFVLYEYMRSVVDNLTSKIDESQRSLRFGGFMLAGGAAKFCACFITYPHEVVRTRLREENSRAKGFLRTLVNLYREGGYRILYKGLSMQLIRCVPNSAIALGVYEVAVHCMSAF